MKRSHEGEEPSERPSKLRRTSLNDRLSKLSDELLVRILSFIPVQALLLCQRVSKKFERLAVDSELWKAAYYNQFVLPRASRIPGIKDTTSSDSLRYSSKFSKWLDEAHLVKNGRGTNWKLQYRLRHNWSQGQCAVSEIVVAERPSDPPLLVMMHDSVVFTADSVSGLRAWDSKNDRDQIASIPLTVADTDNPRLPTSMAVDSQDSGSLRQRVVLGFEDGSFTVFLLNAEDRAFTSLFSHPPSSNGMLSALALSSPYLMTMTEDHLLSLYKISQQNQDNPGSSSLLCSVRSNTSWPPVSLSLRTTAGGLIAAIAYALPVFLSGWSVGIQEIRLSDTGDILESRMSTAAEAFSRTLGGQRSISNPSTRSSSPFPGHTYNSMLAHSPSQSRPTSLSYSHPYLLVTHTDNTLTLYLVKSTSSSLSISSGNRLWGHTSSVSGAHVTMRGKAVSVSRLGDELRVWDLEGRMSSSANRMRTTIGEQSIRVQPGKTAESSDDSSKSESPQRLGLRFALDQGFDDSTVSQGWVGFDDHNAVVLREKSEGSQALVVYDFT